MDNKIKQILKDIYLIDESLRAHEDSLAKIIQDLLESKPESKIDENFVRSLYSKLFKSEELKPQKSMFNFPSLFRRIALAGATFAVLFFAVFLGVQNLKDNYTGNNQLTIKDVGLNAFGEIVFSPQTQTGNAEDSAQTSAFSSDARSSAQSMTVAPSGKGGGGITPEGKEIGMPYPITNYIYEYKGGDFEVSGPGLVYRKTKGTSFSSELTNVISRMNLGLDFSKFSNLKLNSMEISEDREFGYSLYIDLRQNTFSINMNWEKWPVNENLTLPLPNQMPKDEQIIAIADKFLSDYGIDMQKYEKGEVVKNQGYILYADALKETSSIARPDFYQYVSVVYPWMIDGQKVFDQSGQIYGLTVGIDLGYNRVTSVYNINTGNFESSKYDIETNTDKLIQLAEDGGLYGNYLYREAEKSVDIELGTPEQGLVVMWKTEEGKSYSTELFVPALIFPVTSVQDQTYFYRSNVVVPLVGEMQNDQNLIPMPLETKPAV